MSTSYPISGPYPGLEYIPGSPESDGIYHEDREIDGALWRVYNATFDGSQWSYPSGSPSDLAYALVQNTDGSISFKTYSGSSPWATTDWVGSDNHTVFNAADYGMVPGGDPGDNATFLQNAINDAAAGGGGRVFIPAGGYPISGTIVVPATQDGTSMTPAVGILIEGCSGSTQLAQNGSGPIFSMTGDNSRRGVILRNLRLSYAIPQPTIFAVYAESDGVICEDCYFEHCPAMYMGGGHNGLLSCTIFYDVDTGETDDATMIYMTGADNFVALCYIYQKPIHDGGPTGCVGIQIASASEPRISDTNINEFNTGIKVTGSTANPIHGLFSNLACESYTYGAWIQPAGVNDLIYELFFTGCVFQRAHHATEYTTPVPTGVYVDVYRSGDTVGATQNVSDIFFDNCMSHDWAGPGMLITLGQDITVAGGRYGQNATDSSMTTSGAIAVTDAAVRVSIVGADCYASIPPYDSQPSADGPQPYGISVTGAVVGMQVRSCNLTGSASGPLYTPTNGTDLRVTDCVGYNDVVTVPTTTAPANGTTFSAPSYGYYGPVTFYVSGGSGLSVLIDNHSTSLASGSFILNPGHSGKLTYNPLLPHPTFLMLGM